jgi:hypothetical protein
MEVRLWPGGGEEVFQAQALEAFFLQVSQPEPCESLLVHLNQVKWPNIKKPLEACHCQVDDLLGLLVVLVILPAVVGYLALSPREVEEECPQIFFISDRVVCLLPEWPQAGDIFGFLV